MRVEGIGKIMAMRRDIMCATVRALSVRLPLYDRIRRSAGRSRLFLQQARTTFGKTKCSHNRMKPRRNPSALKLHGKRTFGCLCSGQSGIATSSIHMAKPLPRGKAA